LRIISFNCTDSRWAGVLRAKLSRFCTMTLVRCASCTITPRSLRADSGTLGSSLSRSAKPRIAVRGLFTSCATPETSCPMAAIFEASSVGEAHQPGGIRHQNQALRVVEHFAIEIALALQLRLKFFLLSDVENQPAILRNFPAGIAHRKGILQSVDQGPIFAAQ